MVLKRSLTTLVALTLGILAAALMLALLGASSQEAQAQESTGGTWEAQDQVQGTASNNLVVGKQGTITRTHVNGTGVRQRVQETLTFPKGKKKHNPPFKLISATSNRGQCTISGSDSRRVVCDYGVVDPGQQIRVRVTLTPRKAGTFTITDLIDPAKTPNFQSSFQVTVSKS
jgi:hypothetical protein